jgi:predicted aldo/keto reductase-like oxidoreductase
MTTTAVDSLPQRLLGKTGELVPVLGMGTGPGGMGLSDADAIELYEMAIDRGVTYIDTAPGYDRAHRQLGQVVPRRRDEIFLVSKSPASDGAEAVQQLEQSLCDLRTDAVDLCYVHSLGNQDVDRVLAADGALAGLRQAQKRGLTRYVGFTAHNRPAWAERVLREAEVDAVMMALNFADHHTYGFDRCVLPLARAQNAGVAAMKVFGGAQAMEYHTRDDEPQRASALRASAPALDHERALRWALGLQGVGIAVIGMYSGDELEQNIEWVQRWQPLTGAEESSLLAEGRAIASDWGTHYGDR